MTKEELKKEAQEQVNCYTPLYPESFIQGYLAGAEPRENKIADIKANCDFALERKEIEYREERNKLCDDFENMKATLESKIADLEETINKLREQLTLRYSLEDKIKELEQQIEKMKKYGKLLQDICIVMGNNPYMVSIGLENRVEVLWDSSVEEEGLKMVKDIENRLLKIKPQEWEEIDKWEIKENE